MKKKILIDELNNLPELPSKKTGKNKAQYLQIENERNRILKDLKDYDDDIQDVKDTIKGHEDIALKLQSELRRNEENKSINQAEEQRVKKANQEKIKIYKERLNELNRGVFSTEQQPNETEEEYLARLDEIAKTPYDDSRIKFEAELNNIRKLKKNLKELVRNDSMIENVIKSFGPSDIFQLNKIFNYIKTKFLDVFGFNNRAIRDADLIKFLEDALYFAKHGKEKEVSDDLDEGDDEVKVEQVNLNILASAQAKAPDFIQMTDNFATKVENNTLIVKNITNDKKLYFKVAKASKYAYTKSEGILISKSGNQGTFYDIEFRGSTSVSKNELLIKYLGMNDEDIVTILGGNNRTDIYDHLMNYYHLTNVEPSKKDVAGINKQIFGWGLDLKEEIPSGLIKFGKICINLDKLFYKNMLVVKDKSGFNIPALKNTNVSDKFVEIIMKLYKKQNVTPSDINKLSNSEKNLYDELIYLGGFSKDVINNGDKQIENLKNRLQIIEGEIEAGNNNEDNLAQLYEVLMKLVSFNVIGINQARAHYKNIKNEFF